MTTVQEMPTIQEMITIKVNAEIAEQSDRDVWNNFASSLDSDEKKCIFLEKFDITFRIYRNHGNCIFRDWNDHLLPCYKHYTNSYCDCTSAKKRALGGGARGGMDVGSW
jgi:hypothetical protein